MTETIAKTCTVLFVACFTYAMIASYVLRWMIDEEKIKTSGMKLFRSITPPRDVLTPRGKGVWWSKWMALGISLLFLALSVYFHERLKSGADPDDQRTTRGM